MWPYLYNPNPTIFYLFVGQHFEQSVPTKGFVAIVFENLIVGGHLCSFFCNKFVCGISCTCAVWSQWLTKYAFAQ